MFIIIIDIALIAICLIGVFCYIKGIKKDLKTCNESYLQNQELCSHVCDNFGTGTASPSRCRIYKAQMDRSQPEQALIITFVVALVVLSGGFWCILYMLR